MIQSGPADEAIFRKRIQETMDQVEAAFDSVDPDQVECEVQQGALSLKFSDGSKCILSAQPSVRQLWMAVASKGVAFHFNWDEGRGVWLDDKGRGIEALSYLVELVRGVAGLEVTID